MNPAALLIPFLLIASALLCSCDDTAPVPRRVAFDEATFAPFRASGTGAVTGRAAGLFYGTDQVYYRDKIRIADHLIVKLMPDNAYSEEIEQQSLRQRHPLPPPDPRFSRYVRKTTTDGNGNFTFTDVPAGHYYVTCRFTWPDNALGSDDQYFNTIAEQTLYAKISVSNGQTVRVANWEQSLWFALRADDQ